MRILILLTRSDTIGGAQSHVFALSKYFLSLKYQVLVVVGGKGVFVDQLLAHSIPVVCIPVLRRQISLLDFLALFRLASIVKSFDPDVACSHSFKSIFLLRILRILRLLRIHSSTIHGWSHIKASSSRLSKVIFILIERLLSPGSDGVIFVSHADKKYSDLYSLCSSSFSTVIHNGVDQANTTLTSTHALPPCDCRFLSVARFQHPKDHKTLINSFLQISSLTSATLTLIGDGPLLEDMQRMVVNRNACDRIFFLGYQSFNSIDYMQYDVFVLSSLSEGLPLTILEAMSSRLPILASDVGGVSEAVVDNVNGFLFPSADMNRLAYLMNLLSSDSSLRNRLGSASSSLFQQKFSLSSMNDQTSNFLSNLVASTEIV